MIPRLAAFVLVLPLVSSCSSMIAASALRHGFQTHLSSAKSDASPWTPQHGFAALLEHYREQRVQGVDLEQDGDMLLFQWGTHDWGEGETFELDLTRQTMLPDGEDDGIWQLHLTYEYSPSDELRALGSGNKWCPHPNDLDAFEKAIHASEPFRLLRERMADRVSLEHERAG